MCGRYVVVATYEKFEVRYYPLLGEYREVWINNANIGPGTKAPVIVNSGVKTMTFGLTPHWAKKKMYLFNARTEGDRNKENDPHYSGAKDIINKPAFRKAIRSQRCLVPCNGFIEGPEVEKLSKPYYVFLNDEPIFSLAGIWDRWVDIETREVVESFAIITTVSNDLTQRIGHHRSPVIIPKSKEQLWINPDTSLSLVTQCLEPYPAKEMNAYPIDAKIKNPRAQGLDLLEPTGPLIYPKADFNIVHRGHLQHGGKRSKHDEEGKLTLEERVKLTREAEEKNKK